MKPTKTLIFTAQPSSKGFVHQIASQYQGTKKSQGIETEVIDLYDPQYALPFLAFEDIKEMTPLEVSTTLQEKIKNADELVFVFPLWWGGMPAILKNFFDTVFASGFAFQFIDGKPKGLLAKKTAKVLITCDAPRWMYFFMGFPLKNIIKRFILGFCGIKTDAVKMWGKISFRSEKEKKQILEEVTSIALR